MRGVGRSSAAITVVNALPTGVGCALGIQRYVLASVDLGPAGAESLTCDPLTSDTPLVRAAVQAALRQFDVGRPQRIALHLRSDVPMAKGLKSSSAVATAVLGGVARALGASPDPIAVARLAAEVSRAVGLSATGAFDDALAGLRGGFVLTDNRRDSVISEARAPDDWTAVVYLPPGVHAPSPEWRSRFETKAVDGESVAELARAGRFPEAMRRNSDLVESVMGYDYATLRARMHAAGAVAAGVSGLGPALAALVPRERQHEVVASLPTAVGEHFTAELAPGGPT
jgi:shikimate kinase